MEVSLDNNHLLLFSFAWLVEKFAPIIIMLIGLIELIAAVTLYFYDDGNYRKLSAMVLGYFLIIDALVVHCPFTE